MAKRIVPLFTSVSLVIFFAAAGSVFGSANFYEEQLRTGKADFQSGRVRQAADEFRIAAFGFLDHPVLLTEALVRLTVAQSALGMTADLARTINRFLEVEQRFPSYAALQIETPVRSRFEEIVVKAVPRATLLAVPGLSQLANYELLKVAELPPGQRVAGYEAGARREPDNPEWPLALARESAARDAHADVIRWSTKVLRIDPQNKEARPLLLHAYVARRQCREAIPLMKDLASADLQKHPEMYADEAVCLAEAARWKDAQAALANVPENLRRRPDVVRAAQLVTKADGLAQKSVAKPSSSDVLEMTARLVHEARYVEAFRRLQTALAADPNNRALRLGLLEAAVLSKEWKAAGSQVSGVTPFKPGEELYMFYAAVALHETGQKDTAKEFMKRARPYMVSSPIVDFYIKAVLGGT